MSVIVLELKEEHIKLLKHLRWSINDKNFIISTENADEDPAPFGENNIYDAMKIILEGRPENFDPLNTSEIEEYSVEQKAIWDKLYQELPIALDIILFNGHFELGKYRTRYHLRDWKNVK